MASRIFGVYQFEYADDRGFVSTIRSKTAFPPDIDRATAQTLISIISPAGPGGQNTLIRYGNEILIPELENPICSDRDSVKPRRLEFIRKNGNSLSFAMPSRSNLVGHASQLETGINSVDANNPVVCIKLHGEKIINLFERLGGSFDGVSTTPPRGTGGKQFTWHGTLEYLSDGLWGSTHFVPFKIFSDNENARPSWLLTTNCIDQASVDLCTGNNRRKSRRYIATVLGTNVGAFKAEIPVSRHLEPQVLACGQELSTVGGVYCLDYEGESNDRFHNVVNPPTNP